MVITTTAVAYILLGIGLGVSGWRFLKVFKNTKGITKDSKTGFLLSLYFIGFAIQTGVILGLGSLLFSLVPQGLFSVILVANSFLTIITVFSVYMVYYIFFPNRPSLIALIFTFILGAAAVSLTITTPPQPFVTSEGVINWDVPFPLSLVVFLVLLISIGASLYTFIRLFLQSKTYESRILSVLFVVVPSMGLIDAFMDFILRRGSTDASTLISDLGLGISGLVLISTPFILALVKRFNLREKR